MLPDRVVSVREASSADVRRSARVGAVAEQPSEALLIAMAGLFVHQQRLIRDRDRDACFAAFTNNIWAGFAFFLGTVVEFLIL